MRGELIAHFLHVKMREGYYVDQAGKKSKGEGSGGSGKTDLAKLSDMMRAMKGKPIPGIEVIKTAK